MATVWNPTFVKPTDPGYLGWCSRKMQKGPDWGRPRSSGEHVGPLVEHLVRRWLAWQGPLQEERILRWHERLPDGAYAYRYREIDAVRLLPGHGVALYEVKVTTARHMAEGRGLEQLHAAAGVLREDRHVGTVLTRLVYVASEPLRVRGGLPDAVVSDLQTPAAVIWLAPSDIERFAAIEGVALPHCWSDAHARGEAEPDAARDDWRRFADTARRGEAAPGSAAHAFALAMQRAAARPAGAAFPSGRA